MSNWSGGVLTAAGRALQAKVEAGTALVLTCLKVGDGAETAADVDSMTNLLSPKKRIGISSAVPSDNVCKVTGILSSADVSVGFYARELGLFAQDPDVGEILYMIALDSAPDYVPPQTSAVVTSAEYAINVVISNSAEISINVDPNGLATVDMLNKAARILLRNTDYLVNDDVYDTQLRPGTYLHCAQDGTTGTTWLDLSSAAVGDSITDGTVTWVISEMASKADVVDIALTVDDTVVPADNQGALATIINNVANMLKKIKGDSDWKTNPVISLSSIFRDLGTNLEVTTDPNTGVFTVPALGITGLMAQNGYISLGRLFGGLILQWGMTATRSISVDFTVTVPFNFVFPNSCFVCTPSLYLNSGTLDGAHSVLVKAVSPTSIDIAVDLYSPGGTINVKIGYIAIGY